MIIVLISCFLGLPVFFGSKCGCKIPYSLSLILLEYILKYTSILYFPHLCNTLQTPSKKKKSEKQRRIDTLINDYHNDELITKEEFERQLKKMRHEFKAIENQLEKVIDSVGLQQEFDLTMNGLESFSSNICAELDQVESDWKTKQDLIRMLIWQVKIDNDNLYVWFRFQELAIEREKNFATLYV